MLDYQFFENNQESNVEEWRTVPFEDGLLVKGCRCAKQTIAIHIPEMIDGKQVLAVSFARGWIDGSRFPSGANILIPRSAHYIDTWYDDETWKDHVCIHPDNSHFVIKNGLLLSGDMTKVYMRCDCFITELNIPDEVVEICSGAFASAENVESIHLGKNVQKIGDGVFPNTRAGDSRFHGSTTDYSRPIALKAITVSEENETFSSRDGFLYSKDGRTLIKAPEIIPDGIYTVPEGTVCLATGSFAKNQGIQKIVAYHPMDTIEEHAFADCFKLYAVQIDKIGTIGREAFYECFGLKNVSVGTAGTIGYFAFNRCRKLENVHIGSVDIINTAFWDSGLKYIQIPRNTQKVSPHTFLWCEDINVEMYDILPVNPGELAYKNEFSGSGCGWVCDRHWITVRSAEDDRILYRVYMGTRTGTHSKYREAVVKGWGNYPVFDFESLDAAFSSLKDMEEKTEVAKLRLMYPVSLADDAKKQYEDFFRRNGKKIVAKCLEKNDAETLRFLADRNLLKQDIITSAIDMCDGENQPEIMAILLSLRANSTGDIEETLKIPSATELLKKNWSTKKLPDGTLEITSYKGDEEHVVIPGKIGTAVVTRIGDNAFAGSLKEKKEKLKKIKSIIVPAGVSEIGMFAFSGCVNVQKISLPETIREIGANAFTDCAKLADITIPEGVSKIVEGLFCNCKKLGSVVLQGAVTEIGSYAFYGCEQLRTINIPDSVTKIGGQAFSKCKKLVDDLGFTIIGDTLYGYYGSDEDVVIPNHVKHISKEAFLRCKIHSISIPKGITILEDEVFRDCKELQAVSIPEGVVKIKASAFRGCKALQTISIPDSVIKIGISAFASCESLQSVTIPARVKFIAEKVFYFCTALESVTILGGVTEIRNKAFAGCNKLRMLYMSKELTNIATDAFEHCTELIDSNGFSIVNGILFKYYGSNTDISVPKGVTIICSGALNNSSLRSVTLPGSVINIEKYAFYSPLWREDRVTIHAPVGSYAETYAKENNIPFVAE